MKLRTLLPLLFVLGLGVFAYIASKHPQSLPHLPSLPSSHSQGLTDLASRVPKNAGAFVAIDVRTEVNLKNALSQLREALKSNDSALKAWDESEKNLGVTYQEVSQWALPAMFIAVLPANGQETLWGSPPKDAKPRDYRAEGQLTACKSNLKNIGTALEMFSTDNSGRYPKSLNELTPNYLKVLPECPAASKDTYSATYARAEKPDAYTFMCQGHNHDLEPENFPQYTSYAGLESKFNQSAPHAYTPPVPYVVFGAPVADEKMAREQLLKILNKQGPAPEEVSVGDSKYWHLQDTFVGFHDGFMVGSSSKEGLEALLSCIAGKGENLSSSAQFGLMRKKFDNEQGAIGFVSLAGMADVLPTLGGKSVDEKTLEAARALQYLGGTVSLKEGQMLATVLLAVDGQSPSTFVKTLLAAPTTAMQSAPLFPAEWGNYSALDLHYLVNLALEGLRLFPDTRNQVDSRLAELEKNLEVSLEKDIWSALTGEVAWSSDVFKILPKTLESNYSRARDEGQRTSCKSNLKNIATSLEMYSTDNSGHYPPSLALLTPNYLRTIPICPKAGQDTYSKTYKMGVGPDSYTVICAGNNHGQENFPQYNSFTGLEPGQTKEEAPKPAQDDSPTYLVALGVKDAAKAELLLAKLDPLLGAPTPGPKVGEVQLLHMNGPIPLFRCMITKPAPLLLIAGGPKAEAVLTEALQTKTPVAESPIFKAAWKNSPERWIDASYLDLAPLLQAVKPMLESNREIQTQFHGVSELLAGIKEAATATYVSVDSDGIRLVSQGNGAMAAGGLATAAAILVPNFARARSQGQTTACKSNEKNIATALEMYSTDNAGRYPPNLTLLTPNYLKVIPQCPGAHADTYSTTYQSNAQPDAYTFFCKGSNHTTAGLSENFPEYNSYQGLMDGK